MAPAGPRGYDAAKKINGRKRHILTDSCGNVLAVRVTDGTVQDRDGGVDLVRQVRALFRWLLSVVADSAYTGRFETAWRACTWPSRSFAVRTLPKALSCSRSGGVSSKRSEPADSADACSWITKHSRRSPEAMIQLGSIMRFVHYSNCINLTFRTGFKDGK